MTPINDGLCRIDSLDLEVHRGYAAEGVEAGHKGHGCLFSLVEVMAPRAFLPQKSLIAIAAA